MSEGTSRPYLAFYPDSWMGNSGLQLLPLAARGLAAQCLAEMHKGDPYGHLRRGAHVYGEKELSALLRVSTAELRRFLPMLLERGVFARDADGAVYSPRLVRNEAIREKRAAGGRKSIGHAHTHPPKGSVEGYPSGAPSEGGHNGTPKLGQDDGNARIETSPPPLPEGEDEGVGEGTRRRKAGRYPRGVIPCGSDAGEPMSAASTMRLTALRRIAMRDGFAETIQDIDAELARRRPKSSLPSRRENMFPRPEELRSREKPFPVPSLKPK